MNTRLARFWRNPYDLLSILLLIGLCWLYYWRLLTLNPLDQQTLVEGDFSGQFVAFAHYQAQRLGAGEVPLWNPYNLGGHPFLADTQSAVFYPPRLVTIALLNLTGGSTPQRMYYALQTEMAFHTLLASVCMYLFCRVLVGREDRYGVPSALVGAITYAYGGFFTGYPQLQLAIFEAGAWLPLALLGIHEALGSRIRVGWFVLSGVALGCSFLAGHPQTTLLFIYLTYAYLLWRALGSQNHKLMRFLLGATVIGALGLGLAAVQLLPSWEYLGLTTRSGMTFDAKGAGFPLSEMLQVVLPSVFSLWSPLYFGITALMLLIYSGARLRFTEVFWFGVLAVSLLLSLGRGSILYDVFYLFAPGFSLFRQQERAAFLFATAAAILAALGTSDILRDSNEKPLGRRYTAIFASIAAAAFSFAIAAFVEWLSAGANDARILSKIIFAFLVAVVSAGTLINLSTWRNIFWLRARAGVLVALVTFELFTFGRTNANLEAKAVQDRLQPSGVVQFLQAQDSGVYRVAGERGLRDNYGTLYSIQDISGISPLRLARVDRVLNLPNVPRRWELFAVRYVLVEDRQLQVPSRVVYTEPRVGADPMRVHELAAPRPFARVVGKVWVEDDPELAVGYLSDPSYDATNTVMLRGAPPIALSGNASGSAEVTQFKPEHLLIRANATENAMLQVALVDYPGWRVFVNGSPARLMPADLAFLAVPIPSGESVVEFRFMPQAFTYGSAISLGTLLVLAMLGVFSVAYTAVRSIRARQNRSASPSSPIPSH